MNHGQTAVRKDFITNVMSSYLIPDFLDDAGRIPAENDRKLMR